MSVHWPRRAPWPPERHHVETGYRDLPFPLQRLPALVSPPAATLPVESSWDLDRLLGYITTWSATVRCQQATSEDPLPALGAELEPVWGNRDQLRPVVWPLRLLAGGLQ